MTSAMMAFLMTTLLPFIHKVMYSRNCCLMDDDDDSLIWNTSDARLYYLTQYEASERTNILRRLRLWGSEPFLLITYIYRDWQFSTPEQKFNVSHSSVVHILEGAIELPKCRSGCQFRMWPWRYPNKRACWGQYIQGYHLSIFVRWAARWRCQNKGRTSLQPDVKQRRVFNRKSSYYSVND